MPTYIHVVQLYREAGYWRCDSLKRAIEEQMHLYRSTFEVDASGGVRRQKSNTEVAVGVVLCWAIYLVAVFVCNSAWRSRNETFDCSTYV